MTIKTWAKRAIGADGTPYVLLCVNYYNPKGVECKGFAPTMTESFRRTVSHDEWEKLETVDITLTVNERPSKGA